jgi:hypothetical protein
LRDDLVRDRARLDLSRPAHQHRHPEGALPVGVLLVTERGHGAVGPGVHVRSVVGGVNHDRVFGDSELVQVVQQLAYVLIVLHHGVVVERLPAPGLTNDLLRRVDPEVHPGGVEPHEEGLLLLAGTSDEVLGRTEELHIAGLHALLRERPGILDLLLADPAPARLLGGVVRFCRPGVDDAARAEHLPEIGKFLLIRVVHVLGLLLGVQVVEVPEELVEPVDRGQVLVLVAEVVLSELAGDVAERFEQLGNGDVLGLEADIRAGHTHLGQTGSVGALTGDEGRAAGRAALLAVGIGEAHAFVGDAVDVGRAVAHQPVAVAAEVGDADVIPPDDKNVGLLLFCHKTPPNCLGLMSSGSDRDTSYTSARCRRGMGIAADFLKARLRDRPRPGPAGSSPARPAGPGAAARPKLQGRVGVFEKALVAGAEVVQAGLALRGGEEAVLGALPMAGEAHLAFAAERGRLSSLARPNRCCRSEAARSAMGVFRMLPSRWPGSTKWSQA